MHRSAGPSNGEEGILFLFFEVEEILSLPKLTAVAAKRAGPVVLNLTALSLQPTPSRDRAPSSDSHRRAQILKRAPSHGLAAADWSIACLTGGIPATA